MRKSVLALLVLLLGTSLMYAADAAEEAKAAEAAFAKAFADRDAETFFSFVADDATFFSPKVTLSGKAAVREQWSRYFESKEAPFRWTPTRVGANAAGTLAVTHGPVYDAKDELIGMFTSVWQRQGDGSWKVLFDGPGGNPPCPAATKPAAVAPPAPVAPENPAGPEAQAPPPPPPPTPTR